MAAAYNTVSLYGTTLWSGAQSVGVTVPSGGGDVYLFLVTGADCTFSAVKWQGGADLSANGQVHANNSSANGTMRSYRATASAGAGSFSFTPSAFVWGLAFIVVVTAAGSVTVSTAFGNSAAISSGAQTCPTDGVLVWCGGYGPAVGAVLSAPSGGTEILPVTKTGADAPGVAARYATADTTFQGTLSVAAPWFSLTLLVQAASSPQTVTVTGSIPSGEAFGTPTILQGYNIVPNSIPSEEAFGNATVVNRQLVNPASIGSAEAFGTPVVLGGVQERPFDAARTAFGANEDVVILLIGDSIPYGWNDGLWSSKHGQARIGLLLGERYDYNVQVLDYNSVDFVAPVGGTRWIRGSDHGGGRPNLTIRSGAVIGYTLANHSPLGPYFPSDPHLTIVYDGFNETTSPATFATNYSTWLTGLLTHTVNPVVITTENHNNDPDDSINTGVDLSDLFDAIPAAFLGGGTLPLSPVLQKATSHPRTWVLDTQQFITDMSHVESGGVHPTATGHDDMAAGTVLALTRSNEYVTPASIDSAEAFGAPTVQVSGVTVTIGAGVASGETFGPVVVSLGGTAIVPESIASAETFGPVTVTPGGVAVVLASIASAEAFSALTVVRGAVAITLAPIDSEEAFGNAELHDGSVIHIDSIGPEEAFGDMQVLRMQATPTPPERVMAVAAEQRSVSIQAESRVVTPPY